MFSTTINNVLSDPDQQLNWEVYLSNSKQKNVLSVGTLVRIMSASDHVLHALKGNKYCLRRLDLYTMLCCDSENSIANELVCIR